MSIFWRTGTLGLWGGFVYYVIELLWRGYSHPSMFIVGGICFLLIGHANRFLPWNMGIIWQSLIGAALITVVELVSGIIINIWLGLNVWDYSHMPLNILGQVCLLYIALWIPLSGFGIYLDDYLRWKLYGEERPRYKLI